jgi:acetyltransferase-like isoleucine patch superfamily enzyme
MSILTTAFVKFRSNIQRRRLGFFGKNSKWYGGDIHSAHSMYIGEYVYIGPGLTAHAFGFIKIEDGVIVGPRLTIHTRNHKFEHASSVPYDAEYKLKPVRIGRGTWIGDSVILLPGADIGEGCVIGAGSVVSDVIADYSIASGNPAKVVRMRRDVENVKSYLERGEYYLKNKARS